MRIRAAMTATFGLLSIVAACSSSTEPRKESELSAVPTSIAVDGEAVELTTRAYRDFMPPTPLDGAPLYVSVSLPDHLTDISVDRLWILYGDEVWEPAVEPTQRTDEWRWRAGGIPPWWPGESPEVKTIEVVVEVRDQSGNQFRVRDAEVTVG